MEPYNRRRGRQLLATRVLKTSLASISARMRHDAAFLEQVEEFGGRFPPTSTPTDEDLGRAWDEVCNGAAPIAAEAATDVESRDTFDDAESVGD